MTAKGPDLCHKSSFAMKIVLRLDDWSKNHRALEHVSGRSSAHTLLSRMDLKKFPRIFFTENNDRRGQASGEHKSRLLERKRHRISTE
jgi:hypothetical protein